MTKFENSRDFQAPLMTVRVTLWSESTLPLQNERIILVFTNYCDQKTSTKKKRFDSTQFEQPELTLENYVKIDEIWREFVYGNKKTKITSSSVFSVLSQIKSVSPYFRRSSSCFIFISFLYDLLYFCCCRELLFCYLRSNSTIR